MLRYHDITKDSMVNGEGVRVVLWLSGCNHHCKGCHNPITWDINGGIEFDEEAKKELFDELSKDYISGITLSGGDPFHPDNIYGINELVLEIRDKFPDKNIWVYTGYTWDELIEFIPYKLLSNIDIIVDGKFVENLYDPLLHYRGSSNQEIINVKDRLLKSATNSKHSLKNM